MASTRAGESSVESGRLLDGFSIASLFIATLVSFDGLEILHVYRLIRIVGSVNAFLHGKHISKVHRHADARAGVS